MNHERKRKTVLIVEDDESIAETINLTLTHEGYATAVAEDGTRALELLQQIKVDLILTDLVMEPMHGKELLERLENDPALRKIPVIVVSGERDILAIAGRRKAIRKPFCLEDLLKAIEDALD